MSLLRSFKEDGITCAVAILYDHSAIADAVIQGSLGEYADGGVILLRLPAALQGNDFTNDTVAVDQLKELIKVARQFRIRRGCFSVVFASDSSSLLRAMLVQSTEGRLMVWRTHGIIVTSLPQSSILPVLEELWAFTMMNFHLLLVRQTASGESMALVVRHEPYSPEGNRSRTVGHYITQRGLTVSAPLLYEKFENFFGSSIKVTLPGLMAPKVTVHPDGSKTDKYQTIVALMLDIFSEKLNFKVVFLKTESYSDLMKQMATGNSFITPLMFYATTARLQHLDYVALYHYSEVTFAMLRPTSKMRWDSFLRPFFKELWILVIVVLIVMSGSLVLVLKVTSGGDIITSKLRGGRQHVGSIKPISKTRSLFEMFGAVLGQDFSFSMPHTNSFRILLSAWFIFIIVLTTAYKSNLISFLTIPPVLPRYESFKELIHSNVTITLDHNMPHQRRLQTSNLPEHRSLASMITLVKSDEAGLEMALTQRTAHLKDRANMAMLVAEHFTNADGSTDLYLAEENILSAVQSWTVPHDAPYKPQFDKIMLHVIQGGIYTKIMKIQEESARVTGVEAAKKKLEAMGVQPPVETSGPKIMTIAHLQGPFWLLLGGIALGILCFLLELSQRRCTASSGRQPVVNCEDELAALNKHNNLILPTSQLLTGTNETRHY